MLSFGMRENAKQLNRAGCFEISSAFFLGGFVVLACFSFFFFVVAREQCFVRVLVQMRPPDVVDERILVCDIFECYSA
jgi:hypothetical protein